MENKEQKDYVYCQIQQFLSNPPTIIWGSGATVSLGMPSMSDLNEAIKKQLGERFDATNENLERELGLDKYQELLPQIKSIIWDEISKKDESIRKQITENKGIINHIKSLIDKFIEVHPKILNIITTNYDRVLEYVLAYNNIKFTDGFGGCEFSQFDESLFKNKDIVNLIKVHGSLNWFQIDDTARYSYQKDNKTPIIVIPGKNKYRETYNTPYRELIAKSDSIIKKSKSFFAVGFGFNDDHLTPKVKEAVNKGVPIVVITKNITESTREYLSQALKYILIYERNNNTTMVKVKNNNEEKDISLEGDLWRLEKFIEII